MTTASDYTPFGALMASRSYQPTEYRYGFNGMEKDDEVSGSGNSYTADHWQYDSRLGRRWNIDPVVKDHESSYATLANNPIWLRDPNGADTLGTVDVIAQFSSEFPPKQNNLGPEERLRSYLSGGGENNFPIPVPVAEKQEISQTVTHTNKKQITWQLETPVGDYYETSYTVSVQEGQQRTLNLNTVIEEGGYKKQEINVNFGPLRYTVDLEKPLNNNYSLAFGDYRLGYSKDYYEATETFSLTQRKANGFGTQTNFTYRVGLGTVGAAAVVVATVIFPEVTIPIIFAAP